MGSYRIKIDNQRQRLPSKNLEKGLIHGVMPGVNVTVRQDNFGIRIRLQKLIDEENAGYILDHL